LVRPTLAGLLICVLFSLPAQAQTFEDGRAAYQAKDYKKALVILKPMAEEGNSEAQVILGIMYDSGQGVDKDPEQAMKWYIRAAKQGIPVVQHDVGVKYFQGMGITQSYEKAAYWWGQSANAGLADSQFNLGLMYYRGLGLNTDYEKAADLFRKAAEQNHSHAQYSLAVMNAFGQGIEKDYAEALKWFRKSADQGVAQAQYNLGVFYENGYGLEKNMVSAKEWYTKAANQGLEEASEKMAQLADENAVPVTHPELNKPVEPIALEPSISVSNSDDIKREDWVIKQDPNTYTLQLSSLLTENDVRNFIFSNHLESDSAYIKVVVKGTTRYTALYGVYKTFEEAQKTIKQLPEDLQRNKPWVRNFGQLQKLLDES
jgi:TPR repeat protein